MYFILVINLIFQFVRLQNEVLLYAFEDVLSLPICIKLLFYSFLNIKHLMLDELPEQLVCPVCLATESSLKPYIPDLALGFLDLQVNLRILICTLMLSSM